MFELITKLAQALGTSGNENEVRDIINNSIEQYVDSCYTDTLGNLIAVKKGNGKKIMLTAHMDEIGIIATYIDEKGFLRFSSIGGIKSEYALGQKVMFQNGTVGTVFKEEKQEKRKELKLSEMYIDIGAISKEEAEDMVDIGDAACFTGNTILQNNNIISKAMDDRIGCAILVQTIIDMPDTDNELYFVFTAQEELGARGAKTAAYALQPDIALAVDVTPTGDTPKSKTRAIQLGKGPAIKIKDRSIISHPKVKEILLDCVKSHNIPYQLEVLSEGGTDAGPIHLTAGGIPSGAVSIPCRYLHSPVEMINLNDVENAVKLLQEFVKK